MIKTTLVTCARGAAVDRYTNVLSVFEIIEELVPQSYPLWYPEIIMISMYEREQADPCKTDVDIVVRLNDKELFRRKVPLDFGDQPRHRAIIRLHGLAIENPGVVTFQVEGADIETRAYTVLARPVEPTLTEEAEQTKQADSATQHDRKDGHEKS